jgi:hypothetical protein
MEGVCCLAIVVGPAVGLSNKVRPELARLVEAKQRGEVCCTSKVAALNDAGQDQAATQKSPRIEVALHGKAILVA